MHTRKFCQRRFALIIILVGGATTLQPVYPEVPLLEISIIDGKAVLNWEAVAGRSYSVERAAVLNGGWNLVDRVVPATTAGTWNDPEALPAEAVFYRLQYDPDDTGQPGNVLFDLPDGDFEGLTGGGSAWFQATPYNGQPQIVQNGQGFPVTARSGNSFAALGGYPNLDFTTPNNWSVIQYSQGILIPEGPAYLHLWYQVDSAETDPNADVFLFWLADLLGTGPPCQTNLLVYSAPILAAGNTNGWTRISFDLSLLSGQVVCLAFEVRTNFILNSTVYIDDISFRDAP